MSSKTTVTKSRIKRARPATPGTQSRTDHEWQYLACSEQCGEEVRVPKNVSSVTCGRCMQKKVEPPVQRAPKPEGAVSARQPRKVVPQEQAAEVLARLRKDPNRSLWQESTEAGFSSNDPMRNALRLLMGREEYAAFMKSRSKGLPPAKGKGKVTITTVDEYREAPVAVEAAMQALTKARGKAKGKPASVVAKAPPAVARKAAKIPNGTPGPRSLAALLTLPKHHRKPARVALAAANKGKGKPAAKTTRKGGKAK